MSEELRDCPWCGEVLIGTSKNEGGVWWAQVEHLSDCPMFYHDVFTRSGSEEELAYSKTEKAWNTRHVEDAIRQEVAELKKQNTTLMENLKTKLWGDGQIVQDLYDKLEEILENQTELGGVEGER